MVQDEPSDSGTCPRCGGIGCGACCQPADASGFVLLRGGGETSEPAVRLVREFKGPTVRDLLQADPEELDLLPGRVRAMAMALDDQDLAEAERRFDRAVGSILPGPVVAARPHRRTALRLIACGLLLAAAAWLWYLLSGF